MRDKWVCRWSRWDTGALFFALLSTLAFLFWLAVPSSLFLKPETIYIKEGRVMFIRETPLWPVSAEWDAEISVLGRDGLECHANGRSFYQDDPDNEITYQIGAWAIPCLDRGPPFVYRQSWQVYLFDLIPLRPVTYIREYDSDSEAPPKQWRER